jgi:hypothetical protein
MFRISPSDPASRATARPDERSVARPDDSAPAVDLPARPLLEASFRSWVEGRTKADVLNVESCGAVTVPLERALRCLSGSMQPLAPAAGSTLGLRDDVTVGAAATALLQACADPSGPRCRSYRSASFFLVGRALLQLDEDPGPTRVMTAGRGQEQRRPPGP